MDRSFSIQRSFISYANLFVGENFLFLHWALFHHFSVCLWHFACMYLMIISKFPLKNSLFSNKSILACITWALFTSVNLSLSCLSCFFRSSFLVRPSFWLLDLKILLIFSFIGVIFVFNFSLFFLLCGFRRINDRSVDGCNVQVTILRCSSRRDDHDASNDFRQTGC